MPKVSAARYAFEPNHEWRHRFKSVGIEVGIEHRVLDAIQGHSPRNAAEGYGEITIKTQAAAISKLPRYLVTAARQGNCAGED